MTESLYTQLWRMRKRVESLQRERQTHLDAIAKIDRLLGSGVESKVTATGRSDEAAEPAARSRKRRSDRGSVRADSGPAKVWAFIQLREDNTNSSVPYPLLRATFPELSGRRLEHSLAYLQRKKAIRCVTESATLEGRAYRIRRRVKSPTKSGVAGYQGAQSLVEEFLRSHPGSSIHDISSNVGIPAPVAHSRIANLRAKGLISSVKSEGGLMLHTMKESS